MVLSQKKSVPKGVLLPSINSSEDVNSWHIQPLIEELQKVGKELLEGFQIECSTLGQIKDLYEEVSGSKILHDYPDKGAKSQILLLSDWKDVSSNKNKKDKKRELVRLMIISFSGSRWANRNIRFQFSFDTALANNLYEIASHKKVACYFLWCACLNEEDATFFFVPASDQRIGYMVESLDPAFSVRSIVTILKENRYWWVKKFGHLSPITLDLNDWKSEVRDNYYKYTASKILEAFSSQPSLLE